MEIGTSAGLTILSASGSDPVTNFGVPGGIGPQSSPMMYATIFATPSVMVEPQIGFSRVWDGSVSFSSLSFVGQVGYLFNSSTSSSPYVAIGGAFQWDRASSSIPDFFMNGSNSFSVSGPGIGGEVGYRFIVKSALGVRVNARYRRWFSDYSGLNEIGIGVSLGAVL